METKQDMFVKKEYAEIKEIKDIEENNDNELRIYCVQSPNIFNFQIRTYKPITEFGQGKPRNMIATISLDIDEVKKILQYMEKTGVI